MSITYMVFPLLLVVAAQYLEQPEQELEYIVEMDELPRPTFNYSEFRGARGRHTFRIVFERGARNSSLVARAFIENRLVGTARIDDQRLPNLDLSSIRVGFDGSVLEATIRYGVTRSCFINDDGRDRIKVRFAWNTRVNIYDQSYADCGTQTREISH